MLMRIYGWKNNVYFWIDFVMGKMDKYILYVLVISSIIMMEIN